MSELPEIPLHTMISPSCAQQTTIDAHGRALDSAHAKLREHDGQITSLAVQSTHYVERLARVEAATSDNHRLLVTMQGSLEAVRIEQTGLLQLVREIASTHHATHDMMVRHITSAVADRADDAEAGILRDERMTKRLIKLAGVTGTVVVLLYLIYSAITGKPLWSFLWG